MREEFLSRFVFADLLQQDHALETARAVILPVPYDSTTSYRAGTRDGPRAIIEASTQLELYDHELDREIGKIGIHTLPFLLPHLGSPEAMMDRVTEAAGEILAQEKLPVMLGGEHSLSFGMVRALKQRYDDISVLHLDAHGDLRAQYLGTPYNHACVARRITEVCPIVQAGQRSLSLEEADFLRSEGTQPFWAEMVLADPEGVAAEIADRLAGHVYVTIDLDVLDPGIMSAVGTPEPGGLGWYEVLTVLRAVSERHPVVGFDAVELSPSEGPTACAFLAAKLVYKFLGYITTA